VVIFLYAVFVAIVIGWGEHYGLYLRERASMTFIMMPVRIFFSLFPIVIGILIGLPKLISEFRREGNWKCDRVKFAAVGIPALYIGLIHVLIYFPFWKYLYPDPIRHFLGGGLFHSFGGLVFGYLLVDTPYRDTICKIKERGEDNC